MAKYNGIELPSLPEYDAAAYPRAYIVQVAEDFSVESVAGQYLLCLVDGSATIAHSNDDYAEDTGVILFTEVTAYSWYLAADGAWEESDILASDSGICYILRPDILEPVWADFDIPSADGTVYLAASEPEEEETEETTTKWPGLKSWLMRLALRKMRSAKKDTYITGDASSLEYAFDQSTLQLTVTDSGTQGDTYVLSGGNLRIYGDDPRCPHCNAVLAETEAGKYYCDSCGYKDWVAYFVCRTCGGNFAYNYWESESADGEEGDYGWDCLDCDSREGISCPECGSGEYDDGAACVNCGYIAEEEPEEEPCPECGEEPCGCGDAEPCPECGEDPCVCDEEPEEELCPHCGGETYNGTYCDNCGYDTNARYTTCPHCGADWFYDDMCIECGYDLRNNYTTCPSCGREWFDVDNNYCIDCGYNEEPEEPEEP